MQMCASCEGKGGSTIGHLDVKAVSHRGLNQAILRRGGKGRDIFSKRKNNQGLSPEIILFICKL
jgi:hypothetical protein